ncbi:alpha/beta hydrolase, partial [Saccharopolyspora taberi]|uniref:alpha/beta fold hydrolase n=1 Tax=Saccharopolyspora taberi TaxID=60895 RepID=UPI0031CF85BE
MVDHAVREFDVRAGDDLLRGWRADVPADLPPLLLCPGLGSLPGPWRELPVSTLSWRARDSLTAGVTRHVDDALAVLDAAGVKTCAVAGWSAGTAVAAELARRCPDRVRGLVLVGGIPGSSADS